MTKILFYWLSLLDYFCFLESYFSTNPRFVANKSAIFPFLGGSLQEREPGMISVCVALFLLLNLYWRIVTVVIVSFFMSRRLSVPCMCSCAFHSEQPQVIATPLQGLRISIYPKEFGRCMFEKNSMSESV